MALLTDGSISSIDDLSARDSQLLATANTEDIDVTQKLAMAQYDLSMELSSMLAMSGGVGESFLQTGKDDVENVVVTPALKLWHIYRTLEMVYADAYSSQLNDRYGRRRDQFHDLANGAREKLQQLGVGMASDPLPRTGTPTVTAATGQPLADGTYYITAAWTNRSGEEGGSAIPAAFATTGSTLRVTVADAPANAVGWNVYIGDSPDSMVRQNQSPIGTGLAWLQPGTPAKAGRAPGDGQNANYLYRQPRVLQRG